MDHRHDRYRHTAPLTLSARIDQMFPTLTPAQIARIAAHGRTASDPARRGAHRGGRRGHAVLRGRRGPDRDRPAIRRHRDARRGPWTGSVHRRGPDALGPPRARPGARQRAGRGDRAGSRAPAGAGADRQRVERDHHARLHPAPGGADRARIRRRRAHRVEPLRGNAARQGVPDAQRPSVHVYRPRP